jgi:hypothetical protein
MTISDLAIKVRELLELSPQEYKPRHAAYDLKKLRGKQWVESIGKSCLYQLTFDGIRPLLAGARHDQSPSLPTRSTPVGDLYQTTQNDMQSFFQMLGVAVPTA